MQRRRSIAVVLLAMMGAATTALAACAAAPPALRSLDDGTATVCAPVDGQGRTVIGLSSIANDSAEEIALTGVELVGADGVELIGLELRQLDDPDANVVGSSYEQFGPEPLGAPLSFPPASARLLLVGLRSTNGAEGWADALRLEYGARPGAESAVHTAIAMRVVAEGTSC